MFAALILTLPTQPNAVRVRIWRALKALGCAALRDGAYLLPEKKSAPFDALADEVRAHGGTASVWNMAPRDDTQQQEIVAAFDRGEAYMQWQASQAALMNDLPSLGEVDARRRWRAVNDALQTLSAIDYFPGPAAAQAQAQLQALRQALDARFSKGEPAAVAVGDIPRLNPVRFVAKRWATRKRPWVDRLACAWLIRRFIDPQARFLWLDDPAAATPAPRGAIGFDYDGARFTHVGARVTFEVIATSFGLDDDPRMQRIARAVHVLDVGGIPVAEAPGLEAVLGGLREVHADDDQLVAAAATVFDALYAAPGVTRMSTAEIERDGDATSAPPQAVSFATALRFWLKLGFISFGGPAGQIAIMHTELVERRRWISEQRFLHALNYCMLLPGPEAQQLATYIGWLLHRAWGGIVAGALFVLPSLFILIGLSWIYLRFGDVPVVAGLFYGIKPAVTALVLHAAHRIGSRALKNRWMWGIAAAAFIAIAGFDTPFPAIIAAAALVGHFGARRAPHVFAMAGAHSSASAGYGPALIDDHTPTPAHARWSRARFAAVLLVGLVLWAAGMALVVARDGVDGTLAQMAWFFSKAALLTFGGAYAVLPYIFQGAVEQHQWLNATQMIDGLALGETTPGPLIMVVAFVGFVGGWVKQVAGPEALFAGAALAATVATFFTFLPSFVFILAGGPLVEATHGKLGFTAPLSAITAAVVGVILNLALFFAYHLLWPQGFGGRFDVVAAVIGVAAAVALFRFKVGVLPLIGACALAGLAVTLVQQNI